MVLQLFVTLYWALKLSYLNIPFVQKATFDANIFFSGVFLGKPSSLLDNLNGIDITQSKENLLKGAYHMNNFQ